MITFCDVKGSLRSLEGSFWIVGDSKKHALYMNGDGLGRIIIVGTDRDRLFPLSFDIVLERLKYYGVTPLELIEQAEQL